jgi:hypothetical protein
VQFRYDNTTITFSADHCVDSFHFLYHIYLADCGSVVFAAVFLGDIPQGAGAAEV